MTEELPSRYRPLVARLMELAQATERTGDNSAVVAHASAILNDPDISYYPGFAVTVRVERAHALATATLGVSGDDARFVQREIEASRAILRPKAEHRLSAIMGLVEGIAGLVLGIDVASESTLREAQELLDCARRRAVSRSSEALARLLHVRAEAHLLMTNRVGGGKLGLKEDVASSLKNLITRENASRYLSRSSLPFAYQLVAASATHELWAVSRSVASGSADLAYLNNSLVFAIGAASQKNGRAGPPLAWTEEFAITLSQIIIAGATVAMHWMEGAIREELGVFVRRLHAMYGDGGLEGLRALSQAMAGLITSHKSLQQAIFGRGQRLSPDEVGFLAETLEAAIPSPVEPGSERGLLLFRGLEQSLGAADQASR